MEDTLNVNLFCRIWFRSPFRSSIPLPNTDRLQQVEEYLHLRFKILDQIRMSFLSDIFRLIVLNMRTHIWWISQFIPCLQFLTQRLTNFFYFSINFYSIFLQLVSQLLKNYRGSYWLWSYGGWIYNYLCNQCLSQLTLWVRTALRRGVLNTTFCDKVCQWLAAGWRSGYSGFLHQWYWPPRDNWCVVESGVKHNNPIPIKLYRWWHRFDCFYLVHSTVLGGKGITIQRLNGG